jgi:hypothetical protein
MVVTQASNRAHPTGKGKLLLLEWMMQAPITSKLLQNLPICDLDPRANWEISFVWTIGLTHSAQ